MHRIQQLSSLSQENFLRRSVRHAAGSSAKTSRALARRNAGQGAMRVLRIHSINLCPRQLCRMDVRRCNTFLRRGPRQLKRLQAFPASTLKLERYDKCLIPAARAPFSREWSAARATTRMRRLTLFGGYRFPSHLTVCSSAWIFTSRRRSRHAARTVGLLGRAQGC